MVEIETAAFLTMGLLAPCGDENNDDDLNDNPVEEDVKDTEEAMVKDR